MSEKSNDLPQFEIDASVVYQLGEMLISDEIQALVELVKNSYDADATYANVIVDTRGKAGDKSKNYSASPGFISIEDDGFGMTKDDIVEGWLTISSSPKKKLKESGIVTEKGRTPLGDKGLGRLGSQRLGQNIEIWTVSKNSNIEYYVGINWSDFKNRILSKVPILYEADERKEVKKGTRLVISGLRSTDKWEGKEQKDLIRRLSQLIFPFGKFREFEVILTINGKRIDLDVISERVLDVAQQRCKFSYTLYKNKKGLLKIQGKYRYTKLLAPGKGELDTFQRIIGADNGMDFYTYLENNNNHRIPGLKLEDDPVWFISFEQEYEIDDLANVNLVDAFSLSEKDPDYNQLGTVADPGPFSGEIYSFSLRGVDLEGISDVFNKEANFRKFINNQAGVRVFRDGFGIRPFGLEGNDWLELGSGWTSATSYYGLRPNNTLGFVTLSAKENYNLIEATDREGFMENAHSLNFVMLMKRIVKTINDSNSVFRRSYNKYKKLKAQHEVGITSNKPSEMFSKMRKAAKDSKILSLRLEEKHNALASISKQVNELNEVFDQSGALNNSEQQTERLPILNEMNSILSELFEMLKSVEKILVRANELDGFADILESDYEHFQSEIVQFSELAGLGLTAEALTHEIYIIADNLAARTNDLMKKLKKRKNVDKSVITFFEHVQSAIVRIQ